MCFVIASGSLCNVGAMSEMPLRMWQLQHSQQISVNFAEFVVTSYFIPSVFRVLGSLCYEKCREYAGNLQGMSAAKVPMLAAQGMKAVANLCQRLEGMATHGMESRLGPESWRPVTWPCFGHVAFKALSNDVLLLLCFI